MSTAKTSSGTEDEWQHGLSQAVASWLHFEMCCGREELFSEAYLYGPIAQYLQSRFGGEVHTQKLHPVLETLKEGAGDKPRMDFAVGEGKYPRIAIETKWIPLPPEEPKPNTASTTMKSLVMADCIRLQLLAGKRKTQAYLLLAGYGKGIDGLRTRAKGAKLALGDFLSFDEGNPQCKMKPGAFRNTTNKTAQHVLDAFRDIGRLPATVTTSLTAPVQRTRSDLEIRVYLWQVLAPSARG